MKNGKITNLFILLFILFPFIASAQKEKKKKNKPPKAFITCNFSYQVNKLKNKKDGIWDLFYESEDIIRKTSSIGFSIGIGKRISKKSDLILMTGYQNYKFIQSNFFPYSYNHCNFDKYGAKGVDSAYRTINLTSLTLPFEYRYHIYEKGNISFCTSLGCSFNIGLSKNQSVFIILDNGKLVDEKSRDNDKNLNIDHKLNLVPMLKTSLMIQPIKSVFLKIEPFFTYQFFDEHIVSVVPKSNLYNYGVNLGIEYKLK